MEYGKEYEYKSLKNNCKAYSNELDIINDMLASGFYAYNDNILNKLRARKERLHNRINHKMNECINRINK